MSIRTIDVSRWQGAIDWGRVKNSGVAGVWIKTGGADGGLYRDGMGATNIAGAGGVGLPFGTYYFTSPAIGQGRVQARHAVDTGHGRGELDPAIDLEQANGLSGGQLDDFCLDWCDEIRTLINRTSLIYTGAWIGTANSYFGSHPKLAQCRLWIANYSANAPGTEPPAANPSAVPVAWRPNSWSMWQFNSVTRVDGIPGNTVDQNVITPEYWAAQTAPKDELMAAADDILARLDKLEADLSAWEGDTRTYIGFRSVTVKDRPEVWVVTTDAGGTLRKYHIPNPDAFNMLHDIGVIAKVPSENTPITDPAKIAEFLALPDAGPITVPTPLPGNIDLAALARAVADETYKRMAG